jgi:N-acetylneuraminic acid mutarotase
MRTTFRLMLTSLFFITTTSLVNAQDPAVNHNTWTSGTAMPTARMGAAAGAIKTNIYVVGGYNNSAVFGVNEIYNPKTDKWTTGASDPNPRAFVASAVVNKILYVFGGSNFSELLSLTESYNPATNTWTTLAPMPYVQESASAVAVKNVIYVMGGQDYSGFITSVASYNTTTNTWTEEAPLLIAKGWSAVGLLGTSVVDADGSAGGGEYFGENEGYNAKKNSWAELTADPTPREAGCYAAIKGQLYVAGGNNGSLLTLNEAYSAKTKSWTTLAPIPQGVWGAVASAEAGGRMYCFGGGHYQQTVYDYVQIYQP